MYKRRKDAGSLAYVLGPLLHYPLIATSLHDLATLYKNQGRYGEAESLLLWALGVAEEQLGAAHPLISPALNNLAELYRIQGRYEEAEPLYLQVLRFAEEQLGANDLQTAVCSNNLALLYEAQGRYEEVEPFYLQAVKLFQVHLGLEHPQTQQIQMNFLTFLSDRYTNGDMDALLRLLRQEEQEDTTDIEGS